MKFLLGMLVGVGTGVAATLLLTQESDDQPELVAQIQSTTQRALTAAKSAANIREVQLWREFHERVPNPDQPVLG